MIPVCPRRIFMARGVTDMRKQFDTLASLVRSRVDEDPLSGDAFVFLGRRRNRLKVRRSAAMQVRWWCQKLSGGYCCRGLRY